MTFEYICLSITDMCNLSCKYCYRVASENRLMKEEAFVSILSKMKLLGCKTVNITGGEPLIHNGWKKFIKIAHDMGFIVILSTNGVLLNLDDDILNYVKAIAISLDGSCETINAICRGRGQFDVIMSLLNRYKERDYPFKIKLGTVISKYNIDDLENIIPLIENTGVYWRIFPCRIKGSYNQIDQSLTVSRDIYLERMEAIRKIVPSSINFMYDCCVEDAQGLKTTTIVTPDANIYIGGPNDNLLIGNLIKMSAGEIMESLSNKGYIAEKHRVFNVDILKDDEI